MSFTTKKEIAELCSVPSDEFVYLLYFDGDENKLYGKYQRRFYSHDGMKSAWKDSDFPTDEHARYAVTDVAHTKAEFTKAHRV